MLFTLVFLFYDFQEENGKSFLSDDILKFKVHHAVFTAPKFILGLLSCLEFKIAVLQINTTQETGVKSNQIKC